MIPECQPYADSLAALHSQLAESIKGLGTDALDWTPAPGANGLAAIVAHAMGSERFLIGQTVGGIDAHRDRDAEFSLRGVDVNYLKQLIAQVDRLSAGVLAGLSEEDMAVEHPHRLGPKATRWCFVHVIEHVAEHVGHANLTRQLWAAQH